MLIFRHRKMHQTVKTVRWATWHKYVKAQVLQTDRKVTWLWVRVVAVGTLVTSRAEISRELPVVKKILNILQTETHHVMKVYLWNSSCPYFPSFNGLQQFSLSPAVKQWPECYLTDTCNSDAKNASLSTNWTPCYWEHRNVHSALFVLIAKCFFMSGAWK